MSRRIIITFHGLGEPPDWIDAAEKRYWVPVPLFEDIVARTAARPEVEYTFDDGNRSDFDVAAPLLRRHGRVGGFYVLTGRLGHSAYLTPADVRALCEQGMTIGLHGRDHVDWRNLDDRQLAEETIEARNRLAEVAGQPVTAVSIPFGAYNRRVMRHLAACGYQAILTTDGGLADDRSRVRNRTSIRSDMTTAEIDAILAGRASPASSLRRAASTFVRRRLV
ncbi:MAG: polysaccharide deacetylase [Caulobacteraceae bacterium]|nr:polysaccharide deacetylase [Caulobacteraceae bacterium]